MSRRYQISYDDKAGTKFRVSWRALLEAMPGLALYLSVQHDDIRDDG